MTLLQTPHDAPRATGRNYTEAWLSLDGLWHWHVVDASGRVAARGRCMTQDMAEAAAAAALTDLPA